MDPEAKDQTSVPGGKAGGKAYGMRAAERRCFSAQLALAFDHVHFCVLIYLLASLRNSLPRLYRPAGNKLIDRIRF